MRIHRSVTAPAIFTCSIIVFLLFSQTTSVHAAATIFVNCNATGANNGTSWTDAYTSLQSAISAAVSGDEIWVAACTYTPGTPRPNSIVMKEGVEIYGGFAGGETSLTQRNWLTNITILSGDIGAKGNNSDNNYHVVNNTDNGLTAAAVLDGFTIRDGNCAGDGDTNRAGAGMYNKNSSPTISNIIFTSNTALFGAGMNNDGGSPTLNNITFNSNRAVRAGGGMYNNNSSPTITNAAFNANSTDGHGGGVFDLSSSSKFTNAVFYNNSASSGGGVYCLECSSTFTNATFVANSANGADGYGNYAGGFADYHSSSKIRNSIFWGNSASENEQIYKTPSSSLDVSYSNIQGGFGGAGNLAADPLFVDSSIGDLHLKSASPLIDRGNNTVTSPSLSATDLDNHSRIFGETVDMGAYENQAPNQAPTLSGSYTLPDLPEDPSSVPGNPISSFLTGASINDPEGSSTGIAIVAIESSKGGWQYSLDGDNWTDISGISDGSALLLARTASLRFIPKANFNGTTVLTFRAWDGADGRASGTSGVNVSVNGFASAMSVQTAPLSVTVTPVNDAPVLSTMSEKSIDEGSTLTFTAKATDIDGDPLSYTLGSSAPDGASITTAGVFTWIPNEAQGPDTYSIPVIVSDGTVTDDESVSVIVNEVNTAPVLGTMENKTIEEGHTLSFILSTTDADIPANNLTYAVSGLPQDANYTLDTQTGNFSWTPDDGPQSFPISFTVSDGDKTSSQTITVTVTNVAPQIEDIGEIKAVPKQNFNLNMSFTDPGTLDTHTVQITWENHQSETTHLEAGILNFSAAHTYSQEGIYKVVVAVIDRNGSFDFYIVTVVVEPRKNPLYMPAITK